MVCKTIVINKMTVNSQNQLLNKWRQSIKMDICKPNNKVKKMFWQKKQIRFRLSNNKYHNKLKINKRVLKQILNKLNKCKKNQLNRHKNKNKKAKEN